MNLLQRAKRVDLRTKFVLPISGLLIVVILSISLMLIKQQADGFRRELETNGETMVRMLEMNVESGVLFESRYDLEEALSILKRFDFVQYASVANSEGEVLAEIGAWNENRFVSAAELSHLDRVAHWDCKHLYHKDDAGHEFIELVVPVTSRIEKLDRETLGITGGLDRALDPAYTTERIGSIRLILSLEMVNHTIADAKRTVVTLTLVVLLLSLLILTSFAKLVTRPIKKLVEATDQIGRGDLSQKVDIKQQDEIGHLAETFNAMVASLKHSRDEIERYNRTLEQKIVERTLELEEAQAQLIQSEKLSAIGQLAAGVAHELNNPLGGILGYAQFALEKMRKLDPDKATAQEINSYIRYLSDVEAQARRCKTIVQNLLRFSRSSRTTAFDDIDINRVLDDTCTFVEHQLSMNHIDLVVEKAEKLPTIQGNAGQLQQVFTNLIINAMHASVPGTTIKMVTRLSPALGEFAGAVEILCSDQGVGIPPEEIKKIFEPFFTTKEVGKGTGLGLSVSYGIIKEHGGEIKVKSAPGEGTTFTVILPVQKRQPPSDIQNKDYLADMARKPVD
ncbi:MAG: HAMP domain-containing protein [Candidatus Zixiibacteriota bacterium]|nr:MAG: HAMP domain-containing protein [candidate division Zixibacteria bacterium]